MGQWGDGRQDWLRQHLHCLYPKSIRIYGPPHGTEQCIDRFERNKKCKYHIYMNDAKTIRLWFRRVHLKKPVVKEESCFLNWHDVTSQANLSSVNNLWFRNTVVVWLVKVIIAFYENPKYYEAEAGLNCCRVTGYFRYWYAKWLEHPWLKEWLLSCRKKRLES